MSESCSESAVFLLGSQGIVLGAIDGPSGRTLKALPSDRIAARALKRQHTFWCSTDYGGCGTKLVPAIGEHNKPHLRHPPGAPCAMIDHVEPIVHAWIQQRLQEWLRNQGISARTEQILDSGARTDIGFHFGREERLHAIEVQLTPMPVQEWEDRTSRYLRDVAHLSWLFGTNVDDLAAVEANGPRGKSLRVEVAGVELDVALTAQTPYGDTGLLPLSEWTYHSSGFAHPKLTELERRSAQRRRQEEERRRQEEAARARESIRRRAPDAQRHLDSLWSPPISERIPRRLLWEAHPEMHVLLSGHELREGGFAWVTDLPEDERLEVSWLLYSVLELSIAGTTDDISLYHGCPEELRHRAFTQLAENKHLELVGNNRWIRDARPTLAQHPLSQPCP
ncbi:competence protein CoiA family protein [Rhodococcus sp. ACT016]|uniref:competence protein CoiA family protein n=1 Tax=Rhodococcus sp. ACT016 TaxID=3134808 RepID=UPI003D2A7A64